MPHAPTPCAPSNGPASFTRHLEVAPITRPDAPSLPTSLRELGSSASSQGLDVSALLPDPVSTASISSLTFYETVERPYRFLDPENCFPKGLLSEFINQCGRRTQIKPAFFQLAAELVPPSLFHYPSNLYQAPLLEYVKDFDIRASHVDGAGKHSQNGLTKIVRGRCEYRY